MSKSLRQAHELKPLRRLTVPEHIIFVDTETTQHPSENGKIYQKLMLGVAMYCRKRRDGKKDYKETFRFTSIDEFWEFVKNHSYSKTILYLISHNAVFDFIILQHISNLSKLGYKVQFVYEGGVRFISKWRNSHHTIMILDNANWFAGKLARWGDELNLPKLKMPNHTTDMEKWFIYCERDTEILYQLFIWYTKFLEDNDLGSWKYTIASSAFTSFRHRFMNHRIYIPDELEEQNLPRLSYHGGRTECFRIGEFKGEKYYKVDINSMYPFVMANYEYPTSFDGYYTNPEICRIRYTLETHAVIADCVVQSSEPYFTYSHNSRNIYPIGSFKTTLTTEELKLAIDNDWIKSIERCCVYRKRDIFSEYVEFFYGVKIKATRNNQRLLRAFAKLYLNSLYGKFGQRGYNDYVIGEDNQNTIRVSHGYNVQSQERFTIRQLGHTVLYSERMGEGYNSFCAIASHVTANARLYLYDCVLRSGRSNCFYCDTDSIIVNKAGMDNLNDLLDSEKLGFLKLEGECNHIEIVAPKHYYFDNHWTMKGVRHDAEKLSHNQYNQEIWPGLNVILKSGEERYYNYYQTKQLNPRIISGWVDKDGFVHPFRLENVS